MADCVTAADGYSYERAAIASWLQHSTASPVTGKPMQHKRLVPNVLLRQAMAVSQVGNAEAADPHVVRLGTEVDCQTAQFGWQAGEHSLGRIVTTQQP